MANIKVFARVKPCQNINQELFKREGHTLYISSHRQVETNSEICSSTAEGSKWRRFRFTHVFGPDSSQKNVFELSAKDIVEAFFEGFNGTIFAYGQTGAGKTYTIQGVDDREGGYESASESLGLIPQSLSLIFQKIQENRDEAVSLHMSFLEIYKETAYDLLGPLLFRGPRKIKELPKVLVTMGGKGTCHLHGLSCHHVTSEKEALRLYQLGTANRKIAETATNQRSSRSHAIFTIVLSRQQNGAEIFFRSKLHLVDLAGSERVWKSSVVEQQLTEARFINLSLHHLESVIIALQKFSARNLRNHGKKKQPSKCLNRSSSVCLRGTKNMDAVHVLRMNSRLKSASAVELGNCRKGRQSPVGNDYEPVYVPYRNSLLTMVLQDSLGGNCNAVMIAALSLEEKNLCETFSTCRFAQRVARVVNKPIRNEEIDKDAVIKRLQATLAQIYLELATYKASERESMMVHRGDGNNQVDEQECVNVIRCFLGGRINDPVAHGINTPRKFRIALRYLRRMLPHFSWGGDQALESADERDSGIRTGSEPTSPLASEGENDHVHFNATNLISQYPLPGSTLAEAGSEHRSSITQELGILFNSEHEEHMPDLGRPSSATSQPSGPTTSDAETQTTLGLAIVEGKKSKMGFCAEEKRIHSASNSHADVWTWELELQKETLLNRSKMFASRLADQRARLVVMLRQGAVPEDLENEKIVEMQLQKKQREVENKLSHVIKKLADLKHTDRLQHPHEMEPCFDNQAKRILQDGPPTCTAPSDQQEVRHRVVTQTSKELELREEATRQKLLARREQMRNFGFSSPAILLGISSPSPSSISSFRCGKSQTNSSATSSMTLLCEDDRQMSPTPPLNKRNIVVKPPLPKTRISDSFRMNRTVPNSRGAFLRRVPSNQETFSRKDTCATLTTDVKRSPLLEYMSNSRQALYLKSTFPRRIDNGFGSDLSCAMKAPRKVPKRQGARVKGNETGLPKSFARGCLQLNENSSAKAECVPANIMDQNNEEKELGTCNTTMNQDQLSRESECTSYENLPWLSSPEAVAVAVASVAKEERLDQNFPSRIGLKREHRERVKKIRESVEAAEVIQRTWRFYKRLENSKSNR